ncbi:hypothetical protein R84B8_00816 [Treponema sp. R8-4-B8]
MGMPTRQEAIWKRACTCADMRLGRSCKNRFGSYECNGCEQYILNYMDAEPSQAKLLMLDADEQMASLRGSINRANVLIVISIAIIVGFVGLFAYATVAGNKQARERLAKEALATAPKAEARHSTDETNISNTLSKVAIGLTDKKDINRDGKVNCIDAALMFYKYYPDKSKVRIYWNKNTAKDFNHMFNLVLINGTWVGVEPQTKFFGESNYRMRPVWGAKYDYTLNIDVTNDWARFAK